MDQKKEFYVGIDIGRDRAMISLYREESERTGDDIDGQRNGKIWDSSGNVSGKKREQRIMGMRL